MLAVDHTTVCTEACSTTARGWCFGETYARHFLPGSITGTVLYTLGIPAVLSWWLFRCRQHLKSTSFVARYSSLYGIYRARMYAWEAVVMLEKAAVIAIGYLLPGHPRVQIFLFSVVFACTISLGLVFSPYLTHADNHLDVGLKGCLLVFINLVGIFADNSVASTAFAVLAALIVVAGLIGATRTLLIIRRIFQSILLAVQRFRGRADKITYQQVDSIFSCQGRLAIRTLALQSYDRALDLAKICAETNDLRLEDINNESVNRINPAADAVLDLFTSGLFLREALPSVRRWLEGRCRPDSEGESDSVVVKSDSVAQSDTVAQTDSVAQTDFVVGKRGSAGKSGSGFVAQDGFVTLFKAIARDAMRSEDALQSIELDGCTAEERQMTLWLVRLLWGRGVPAADAELIKDLASPKWLCSLHQTLLYLPEGGGISTNISAREFPDCSAIRGERPNRTTADDAKARPPHRYRARGGFRR